MHFVLDANVALKCFFPEDLSPLAREVVLTRAQVGELTLIAPDILVAEFGHGLRTHVSRKGVLEAATNRFSGNTKLKSCQSLGNGAITSSRIKMWTSSRNKGLRGGQAVRSATIAEL